MPIRFDNVEVRKPERTAQGFLRADAVLTRAGVFTYRQPDGTTRRELRPADEVFRADSLATFEDAPVTVDHPDAMVTKDNARKHAVGTVKETPRRDGDFAVARVLVTDAAAIADIESGKRSSVSCGYECDYDPTPGVTAAGERFDGRQLNIRGNHLALVASGRAGPDARVRLDAADAVQLETQPSKTPQQELFPMKTKTIRIDGVDHDLPEHSAQIIEREVARRDGEIKTLGDQLKAKAVEHEKAQAKADQLEDEAKKLRADAAPEAMAKLVNERVELMGAAYAVLGEARCDELKVDALASLEIKRAIVLALSPEAKLEGKSPDYIGARYDQAIESLASEPQMGAVKGVAMTAVTETRAGDVDKARRDAIAKSDEAWKKPLSTSRAG